MIRVLVADDHAVVRRGVIQILSEADDMIVVGETSNAYETLQLVQARTCDVLLLDIAMPGGGGLAVLERVRGLRPDLRVLVLSIYSEQQYAARVLRAGAAGYLSKDSAPDELIAAIRCVFAGGRYVSPDLLQTSCIDPDYFPHSRLSDREFQVLRQLAVGKTVGEIAVDLTLSPKTISTYRARILEKLGLHTTAEIVRYAFDHHLID